MCPRRDRQVQLDVALTYLDPLRASWRPGGQRRDAGQRRDHAPLRPRRREERTGQAGRRPAAAEVEFRRQERIDLQGQAAAVSGTRPSCCCSSRASICGRPTRWCCRSRWCSSRPVVGRPDRRRPDEPAGTGRRPCRARPGPPDMAWRPGWLAADPDHSVYLLRRQLFRRAHPTTAPPAAATTCTPRPVAATQSRLARPVRGPRLSIRLPRGQPASGGDARRRWRPT